MALEELQDLKGVWSELSKVWEQIDQMKEQPWVSVQPRKVRVSNTDTVLPFTWWKLETLRRNLASRELYRELTRSPFQSFI